MAVRVLLIANHAAAAFNRLRHAASVSPTLK
jgi:hypothetical protein